VRNAHWTHLLFTYGEVITSTASFIARTTVKPPTGCEVLLIFRTVDLLRFIPESEGMRVAESQEVFSRVSG
jgi:hypothetical protein